jgi:hypothetical protein
VPATAEAFVVAYCADAVPLAAPERFTVMATVSALGAAEYAAAENVTVSAEFATPVPVALVDTAPGVDAPGVDAPELEDDPPPQAADNTSSEYGRPRRIFWMIMCAPVE